MTDPVYVRAYGAVWLRSPGGTPPVYVRAYGPIWHITDRDRYGVPALPAFCGYRPNRSRWPHAYSYEPQARVCRRCRAKAGR